MSQARGDEDLPDSVLFACNLNAVRSPMALGIARYLFGKKIFFDSAGVRAGETDPFMVAVLDEIGIDMEKHKPRSFDDLEDSSFDLVITSPVTAAISDTVCALLEACSARLAFSTTSSTRHCTTTPLTDGLNWAAWVT